MIRAFYSRSLIKKFNNSVIKKKNCDIRNKIIKIGLSRKVPIIKMIPFRSIKELNNRKPKSEPERSWCEKLRMTAVPINDPVDRPKLKPNTLSS